MSTLTLTPTALPAPRTHSHRLTRRGRLTVLALALVVLALIAVFWASGSVATEEQGAPAPTEVVLVDDGDTLWGIALDHAQDGDVRAMVEQIQELNALDSGMVSAGQRLRVPVQ